MTTIINASPTNGIVQTADGSGVMKLQSNGVTTNALAWVNFNGTGTVAIRSAYNVSSITDNGTGDYTVNFTNALSDANYCVNAGAKIVGNTRALSSVKQNVAQTTTAVTVISYDSASIVIDADFVYVSIFGN